jgi:hypothetical protein
MPHFAMRQWDTYACSVLRAHPPVIRIGAERQQIEQATERIDIIAQRTRTPIAVMRSDTMARRLRWYDHCLLGRA